MKTGMIVIFACAILFGCIQPAKAAVKSVSTVVSTELEIVKDYENKNVCYVHRYSRAISCFPMQPNK